MPTVLVLLIDPAARLFTRRARLPLSKESHLRRGPVNTSQPNAHNSMLRRLLRETGAIRTARSTTEKAPLSTGGLFDSGSEG